MSYKAINKYLTVSANAIYAAEEGVPLENPCVNDAEVTLPAIAHPVTTVAMMGSYDVADEARVDNLQITISCQTQKESLEILKHKQWIIRFAMQVEDAETGLSDYHGFTAYVSGNASSFGGGSQAVGETGNGDVTINAMKYRLVEGDEELINIDRLAGRLIIGGVDKRAKLNSLL